MRARLNRWRRRLAGLLLHRIVFGERAADGRVLRHTRISPSTCIEFAQRLDLADHVFIGHYNFIEASGGVVIEEGVQVTNYVSVLTHSSHRAIRLMGREYATAPGEPAGMVRGSVHIGAYTFIGPHSVIEPGTRIGKGSVVAAHSVVRGAFPEFSLIQGRPAQRVGDTRELDRDALAGDAESARRYREWAGQLPQDME